MIYSKNDLKKASKFIIKNCKSKNYLFKGKGGAGNREGFLKKIETRSPHTRIDKAVLDLNVIYSPSISYRFSLRFNDNGAYADKHYLLFQKDMGVPWVPNS